MAANPLDPLGTAKPSKVRGATRAPYLPGKAPPLRDVQAALDAHAKTLARPARRPKRAATPIVTEHTRGQAHAGLDTRQGAQSRGLPADLAITPKPGLNPQDVQSLGLISTRSVPLLQQAAGNLMQDAYYAPGGLYATLRAPALDIAHGQYTAPRTRSVLEQIAKGTYETARHPERRPGDSALLAFAALSAGAAQVAKAGTVGRELGAGNLGAAAKAAVTRSAPGEINLPGGAQALQPDNPLLRPLHRRRMQRITSSVEREQQGAKPGRAPGVPSPQGVVGRELRAREQVQADIAHAPIAALERMSKRLTPEQHTALRVIATEGNHALRDPEGTLARQIATHQRYVSEADARLTDLQAKPVPDPVKIRKAEEEVIHNQEVVRDLSHPGVLDALKSPPQDFLRTVAQARRVSNRSADVLYGSTDMTAEGGSVRLAKIAAAYGNPEATGVGFVSRVKPGPALVKERARVARLQKRYDDQLARAAAKTHAVKPAEAEAILAELDARFGDVAKQLASAHKTRYPNVKAEVASRNRRSRRAKKANPLPTVNQEAATAAERQISDLAAAHPDEPFARLLVERDRLRQALSAKREKGTIFEGMTAEEKLGRKAAGTQKAMASPTTTRLGAALSVAKDRLRQLEERHQTRVKRNMVPATGRAPKGAFYYPTGEQFKNLPGSTQRVFTARRPSAHGIPPVQASSYLGGTLNEFTGEGLRRGVVTRPAEAIAARATGTARLASAERMQQALVTLGTPEKISDSQVLVRTGPITDHIRREVAAALEEAQSGKASALVRAHQRIADALYPGAGEDGVWVDQRFIKELPMPTGSRLARIGAAVNLPFRFLGVYFTPKYVLLNRPQNLIMRKLMQVGLPKTELKGRVSVMRVQLGDNLTAKLEGAAGEGRTASYVPHQGKVRQFERFVTDKIMRATDADERLLSVLGRAAEKGYKSEADIRRLFADNAPAKVVNDRIAIARRARKDLVDFTVTPLERELSDVFYFYPWLSRGSVWAGRWLLNRPGQAALAAQFARLGWQDQRNKLGPVPSWLQSYAPVGGGRVSNLGPLFTPTTPAQIVDQIKGLKTRGTVGSEFGTPALQFLSSPVSELKRGAPSLIAPTLLAQRLGLLGSPGVTFPEQGVGPAVGGAVIGPLYPRKPNRGVVASQVQKEYRAKNPSTVHGRLQADMDALLALGVITNEQHDATLAEANSLDEKTLDGLVRRMRLSRLFKAGALPKRNG